MSFGEHTGTHFDAPIHWITGRDLPNNATDTIPLENFIASASVVDCSREAAADADYLMGVAKLRAFEERHGRILPRSWVLMRTDWSKRSTTRSPSRTSTRPASTRRDRMSRRCASSSRSAT